MYLCGLENSKYRFIIKISGFKSTKVFDQPLFLREQIFYSKLYAKKTERSWKY